MALNSLDDYSAVDAIVIGGGPAGLLGALYLARFRRTVLLLDGGQSRTQRVPLSHNYPGFPDGIAGRTIPIPRVKPPAEMGCGRQPTPPLSVGHAGRPASEAAVKGACRALGASGVNVAAWGAD